MDIGEAAVDAVAAIGEFGVVDAEQVKEGGVDVVHFGWVGAVLGFVAPVIAFADGDTAFDSAAAQPVGEDVGVMVASFAALGAGHSAELGCPEDDGVFEHAALFQVLDECGGAACEAACEGAVIPFDVLVAVPVPAWEPIIVSAPDLDETHSAFEEAASGEAFATEDILFFGGIDLGGPVLDVVTDPVHLADGGTFFRDIEGFGSGELHSGGEFVASDAGFEAFVAGVLSCVVGVESGEEACASGFGIWGDVFPAFVGEQIGDGGFVAGVDHGSLVLCGEEGGVPVLCAV